MIIINTCNNHKKHLAVKLLSNNYIVNIVEPLKITKKSKTKPWVNPVTSPLTIFIMRLILTTILKTFRLINSKTLKQNPS